jgi:hypothetical protein
VAAPVNKILENKENDMDLQTGDLVLQILANVGLFLLALVWIFMGLSPLWKAVIIVPLLSKSLLMLFSRRRRMKFYRRR